MKNNSEEIVLALRAGTLVEAAALLAALTLEEIKPVARALLGLGRKSKIPKTATVESLSGEIMKTLEAGRKLAPPRPALGGLVRDQESGEKVKISDALAAKAQELTHRMQQAEYSVERGLMEICRIVKEFRDERAYLVFGFKSFSEYCEREQLKILGQTRSRPWAYQKIQMIETLGEEVVYRARQLSQRQMLQLSRVLADDGMETTLEKIKGRLRISYRGDDGVERTLALPETAEDARQFGDVLSTVLARGRAAKREALAAEDELVTERELFTREKQEYSEKITELTEALAAAEGRGDVLAEEIEAAEKLTPEQIAKLLKDWQENRETLKRTAADLRDAQKQSERLAGQIDKHMQVAADVGNLKIARELCEAMTRKTDEAIEAVADLRAMGADLPVASQDLLRDSAVRCESQFRQLVDELTLEEEVA